jgi:hypothetical protein
MKVKNLFFVILVLLTYRPLFAQQNEGDTSCRYRNLMEDNWLRLRNQARQTKRFIDMPAYDQGRTGLCYAYSSVQLVDYWRQSRGFMPDERIAYSSPIYMAMVHKIAIKDAKSLNIGAIHLAVSAMKKYGLCYKDVVNQDVKEFLGKEIAGFRSTGKGTGVQVGEDIVFTQLTQGFLIQPQGNKGGDEIAYSIDPKQVSFKDYLGWAKSPNQIPFIKNLDENTLRKVYDAFMSYFIREDYVGFIKDVLKSCEEKKNQIKYLDQMPRARFFEGQSFSKAISSKKAKDENEYFQNRKNQYRDMIRELLNRKNAPAVGVAYCGSVLRNPGALEIDKKGKRSPNCGPHISVLVGKRELGGKCQYLLKNTWNNPEVCEKQNGCIYREVQDPITKSTYQEEMGAWVNEEDILNNIYGLTYIYPSTKEEKEIEEHWRRIEEKYIESEEVFLKSLEKIRKEKR